MSRARITLRLACGALLALALGSCAYYNTFYLARKSYDLATLRQPYLVDPPAQKDVANFQKAIDFSKKLIAQYPKSKWVDDAYLLWARSLLGKDDPLQTVTMLQDFTTRYPKSPITSDARFYLGVAYRQGHKYHDAVRVLDEFLSMAPHHSLVPYAQLERARALASLERWDESAAAAGVILDHYPRSGLVRLARIARADATFRRGDFAAAQQDYRALGFAATDDEERLTFLFREADCLEAAKQYDPELALLRGALSHEAPPPPQPDVQGNLPQGAAIAPATPAATQASNDRYGRIQVRIGTASLLDAHLDQALEAYREVAHDYPRTPLAAEAQYRVGYAYETVADDFAKASEEYAKVKDIANSAFSTQATSRLTNLDRLAKFKGAGRDTVAAKAEVGFLLAEQYLFGLDKPDRALEEYAQLAVRFPDTPWQAKAMTAQGWVLSRKYNRKAAADSLFWRVVREHPATEAQLAARDYLEMDGIAVPESLIKLPAKPEIAPPDTALTPVPGADSLGLHGPIGLRDSLAARMRAPGRFRPPGGPLGTGGAPGGMFSPGPVPTLGGDDASGAYPPGFTTPAPPPAIPPGAAPGGGTPGDSTRTGGGGAARDTTRAPASAPGGAPANPPGGAPPHAPFPADTSHAGGTPGDTSGVRRHP